MFHFSRPSSGTKTSVFKMFTPIHPAEFQLGNIGCWNTWHVFAVNQMMAHYNKNTGTDSLTGRRMKDICFHRWGEWGLLWANTAATAAQALIMWFSEGITKRLKGRPVGWRMFFLDSAYCHHACLVQTQPNLVCGCAPCLPELEDKACFCRQGCI